MTNQTKASCEKSKRGAAALAAATKGRARVFKSKKIYNHKKEKSRYAAYE
jgi:hypothetical protein